MARASRPHPGAAELQQVDGLPADIHVVGDVPQEHGDAVLHLFGNKHVAVGPVKLIYVRDKTAGSESNHGPDPPRVWGPGRQPAATYL